MQTRYIVTKASDDGTFSVGNHITYAEDGAIICQEAKGWIAAENVPEATKGMESHVDLEWIDAAVKELLKVKDECVAEIKRKQGRQGISTTGRKIRPQDYFWCGACRSDVYIEKGGDGSNCPRCDKIIHAEDQ